MSPDIVSVVIRAIGFVLLFQAIGATFFVALFAEVRQSTVPVQRLILASAIAGIVAISMHWALEAARMTGEFSGVFDALMQHRVMSSSISTAHALPILGLTSITMARFSRSRLSTLVSCIGGSIAIAGFLFVGHTSIHPWRALLAPLLAIHLLIVAFWFGSLLPLWIAIKREPLTVAAAILNEFSRLATWLVPMIAIAGLVMTLLIARGIPTINEPYGMLIAAKVIGFVLLMGLAAWNKLRLVPRLTQTNETTAAHLRRSVILEYTLIVMVLSVTATMTALFSPGEK